MYIKVYIEDISNYGDRKKTDLSLIARFLAPSTTNFDKFQWFDTIHFISIHYYDFRNAFAKRERYTA